MNDKLKKYDLEIHVGSISSADTIINSIETIFINTMNVLIIWYIFIWFVEVGEQIYRERNDDDNVYDDYYYDYNDYNDYFFWFDD
jgi:hypothetical protein